MPSPQEPRPHRDRDSEVPIDLGWDEVSGELTARWPRLNEHDLQALASEFKAFAAGNYQLLVGRLRERYGLDESTAEQEVQVFVRSLDPSVRGTPLRQQSAPTVGYGRPLGGK
jgi:hypothetical protein